MGSYTIASDNALHEKVFWHANGRRLSVENFDEENVDELIKIRQIRQYFPRQNFAPYGIPHCMGGSKHHAVVYPGYIMGNFFHLLVVP